MLIYTCNENSCYIGLGANGFSFLWACIIRSNMPLVYEKASIDSSAVQEEWDDMVEYSKQCLNLIQDGYKIIWWKLFNSVDAKNWWNVLVVESNGH